jgi:photosystem II stability/assembly factor-like uncharacterized protein
LLFRALVLLAVAASIAPLSGPSAVRPVLAADWQPTGLTDRTFSLHAPTSGAFFARTPTALMRSDDGGAQWRPVSLPPGMTDEAFPRSDVAVDPNDHTRVYVGNSASRDDGATWTVLDESSNGPESNFRPVASAADPNLLYLAVSGGMERSVLKLRRSRDGGSSWDTILDLTPGDFRPGAGVSATVFAADPSDPNVVFQTVVGFTGHGNQGVLRRSDNQGQTWKEALYSAVRLPRRLVGGQGAVPGRFYVAMSSDEVTSAVFRSDDSGITWAETSALGEQVARREIRGLTYDPAAPDRVWVAPFYGSIQASDDGGKTWSGISPSEWAVNDLALGVDGANLYAATNTGVFRLPLR